MCQQICYAQSVIYGTCTNSWMNKDSTGNYRRYYTDKPQLGSEGFEHYKIKNDSFSFKINNIKPEILRVSGDFFFILPNDSLRLDISGDLPIIIAQGFNNDFLLMQKDMGELSTNRLYRTKENITVADHLASVDSSEAKNKMFLNSSLAKFNIATSENIDLINDYLTCQSIHRVSMLFVRDTIQETGAVFEYLYKRITTQKKDFTASEWLEIGLNFLYTKGLLKQIGSFTAITKSKYWNLQPEIKRLVAVQMIQEFSDNRIQLTKPELQILKEILCVKSTNTSFCDYYTTKVEYGNLRVSEIANKDFIISTSKNKIPAATFLNNKRTYIYLWASWCGSCVSFLKNLDTKKLDSSTNTSIIFLSIDSKIEDWRNASKKLQLPGKLSYLLKGGLQSGIAKAIKLGHVPFIIKISNNKIDRLNVPKNVLDDFLKH